MLKNEVLGIIFPNTFDDMVPELTSLRLMGSVPFAARYRMVDFVLSSMVNSGITNVMMLVRNNYLSLMDHVGSGQEWDLIRKNGGLHIIPPYAERTTHRYNGRVNALNGMMGYLKKTREKYVVIADTHMAMNYDFEALVQNHKETGADITFAYIEHAMPEELVNDVYAAPTTYYYSFYMDEDSRIRSIHLNDRSAGIHNLSTNIMVIDRELLITLVEDASKHGNTYIEKDILIPRLEELNVRGLKFEGYCAVITGMKSYFDESMKLLEEENLNSLFGPSPIYTKVRDDNPTRYIAGAKVSHIMAADGCVIEGEVQDSILFRGVKIGKGAVVKNSILMQDTVVEDGAVLDHVIADKEVVISAGKELKGADTLPYYLPKFKKV